MKTMSLALAICVLAAVPASGARVEFEPGAEPLSVEVLEPGVGRTVLEFEIGRFEREPIAIGGDIFEVIHLGTESQILQRGHPDLPNVCRSVLLPETGAVEIRVLETSQQEIAGIRVAPSKGNLPRTVNPADVPHTFAAVYDEDEWYPANVVTHREPHIIRDFRGVVVVVNPFQYNARTRTLRVTTHLKIEVVTTGASGANELRRRRPLGAVNRDFDQIYREHFINYQGSRYTPLAEQNRLLVVCYDAWAVNLQPFVDWKNQMGVRTELVTRTQAGTSAAGIKAFVQAYYDSTDLAYLLLVGDHTEMPTFSAAGGASDPSYSLLVGTDNYPEIFVGRFSAENTGQLDTQVLRTIAYERDPQSAAAWYHRGTGIGSAEGPGDDGEYDWEHIDNIRTDLLGYMYTEVDQIYDPGASASQVTAALNAGRSIVNYCGHGGTTSWSTTGFSNTHIDALTNDDMLPFIISVACLNGQFNGYTCFGETWLRATNGTAPTGAIGCYASSIDQDWNPPMAAQDEIADLLVADAKRTFGGLCFNGSMLMMDEYGGSGQNMFLTWHIFGDPSLRVRTDTPVALTVEHDDYVDPLLPMFTVTVVGVEGALCALSYLGELLGAAVTNASGVAEIPLGDSLPIGEDVTLTVTAYNGIPAVTTVPVGVPLVPTCDVTPTFFTKTLPPDSVDIDGLHISNNGEEGSLLYYSIELVDPNYPRSTRGGLRDMTGSYALADPLQYKPGSTVDVEFTFHDGSPDEEWLERVELNFPSGVSVNSGTAIQVGAAPRIAYGGATGNGVTAVWDEGGYPSVVYNGETGTATLNLTFAGVTGDVEVPYTLTGDGWGGPPHKVTGTITFTMLGPNILVQSPNGGEAWAIDEIHSIDFLAAGGPEYVRIELDRGIRGWEKLADSVDASAGSYTWTVTSPTSAHCRIRVADVADPAVADSSDGEFTIFRSLDWISLDSYRGFVPQGETDDLVVTFDTRGLPPDTYEAEIVISSNVGEPIVVPVTLTVTPPTTVATFESATRLVLEPNRPNPFADATHIRFTLPRDQRITLAVYDVRGRLVRVLAEGRYPVGTHTTVWHGENVAGGAVASGVYFYRLATEQETITRKLVRLN
jgi:hypothetical protein